MHEYDGFVLLIHLYLDFCWTWPLNSCILEVPCLSTMSRFTDSPRFSAVELREEGDTKESAGGTRFDDQWQCRKSLRTVVLWNKNLLKDHCLADYLWLFHPNFKLWTFSKCQEFLNIPNSTSPNFLLFSLSFSYANVGGNSDTLEVAEQGWMNVETTGNYQFWCMKWASYYRHIDISISLKYKYNNYNKYILHIQKWILNSYCIDVSKYVGTYVMYEYEYT